jgi:hypothetical protein
VLEWVEGPTKEEGMSLEMIGLVGAWGLMSVMNMSLTNVMPKIFSIIIIIQGAYP